MNTPRARSPRPLPPLSSKRAAPLAPPPQQRPLSAATSPRSHDFLAFSSASSPPFFGGGHLDTTSSMSRAPIGRVGSDLSHISYSANASTRHATTSYGSRDNRERAKIRTPPFFSGLGGAWRKETSGRTRDDLTTPAGGKKLSGEETRKDKAKRALDLGQRVKKYMTAVVDQLRSSLHRPAEREQRRRPRPHSFSGRGPNAVREMRRRGAHQPPLSSAPASLRVSPANSGHLSVGGSVKVSTSSEESTMEELQSAIEAAIAHCKNSISRAQQADGDGGRRGDRAN